jgi:hypothetical protein
MALLFYFETKKWRCYLLIIYVYSMSVVTAPKAWIGIPLVYLFFAGKTRTLLSMGITRSSVAKVRFQ